MGRTQLQDAVPMTLGQEFNSFASTIAADLQFLESVASRFYTVNMGGTAIGTGIAATTGYARACARHLRAVTGLPIVAAEDKEKIGQFFPMIPDDLQQLGGVNWEHIDRKDSCTKSNHGAASAD